MPETDANLGAGALILMRGGMGAAEIAHELGVCRDTVYRWLNAARTREASPSRAADGAALNWKMPRLQPLFGVKPFTPVQECPHHGPIRQGSVFCCMHCHQSGYDLHHALRIPRGKPRSPHKFRPKGQPA